MPVLKRLLDVVGATALLAISSPLLVVSAAAIRLTLGSPVFFRQQRPGLHGRPFQLIKFRTMRSGSGSDGQPLPDAQRLTRLGNFLRSTSIDELPELWNVLRGDMSLVGPRPLLVEYLPKYTSRQAKRHEVRPGITGWAQVCGRQTIPFSTRLELDAWYVENWSMWLDLKILAMTVRDVVRRSGVIPGQDIDEVDDLGLMQEDHGGDAPPR